jgi:hypothetical protein
MEIGAFALVDKEDAISKAKREERKQQRTKIAANSEHEADGLSSTYPLIYKQ